MSSRRGILSLCVPVLLAAALPLHAQYRAKGCPQGPNGILLDSFTAGTPTSSIFCILGAFTVGTPYSVQLVSPLTSLTVIVQASATGLVFDVPPTFYASVANPNAGDSVTVGVSPNVPLPIPNFRINPPMKAGGPLFIGEVGTSIAVSLYTGGTAPFTNGVNNGQGPPGMDAFPQISPTWTGTPNQTGTYQITITGVDPWGNGVTANLAFYIVPKPALTLINPTTALAGAAAITLTLSGTGFLSPTTVNETPVAGTTVVWTPPVGTPVTLTPSTVTANQLTVLLPANLLASAGYFAIQAFNPNSTGSSPRSFTVTPSVTALSVTRRTAGTSSFALGVTGTGFVNGSSVWMNGLPIPTTFVDSARLTATFPTVAAPGNVNITVVNPDETQSPISALGLLTIVAQPTIGSLSPTSANQGGPALPLTVSGLNYAAGMTIYFNSIPLTTTVANSGQLTATVPASALLSAGTVPVGVATSDGFNTPSVNFTIVGTGAPLQLINFSPLPGGVINTPYSVPITATGGSGTITFSVTGGTLPAGLRLSPGGLLSGTPTAAGQSRFILQAIDSSQATASRDFSLTILSTALTLTTAPLANVPQNVPIVIQFAGNGGILPYTFVEFGTLPPGMEFLPGGLFAGTPTKAGAYSFLVFVNDSAGSSASGQYTLNVAVPGLLITPPSPLPAGQINLPYSTLLAATGGNAPYTWSATGLPSGLTISNTTGLVAGIPRESGNFTLAITILDVSGSTVTQNYSLSIASSRINITTAALSNGAVGSPYSASVAATGGSGAVTFTATGLPPGVTLTTSGTLTGTPTTAGPYTVAVTATDSQGLTATAQFSVTIASKLVVTGVTISNAVLGSPITATKLSATGGTPPYQWQSANPAPGLSLAVDGTLSGTPSAQGTFSFTVFVVDNSGSLSSGTIQVTVGLPAGPAVTITGLPAANAPASQPRVQIALAAPYPVSVTAKLTLTFSADSGPDDPSVQFSSGGRTAQIVVPAGSTGGLTDVGLQTGTVAGTINVSVQLLAGALDVTPSPAPTRSIRVTPSAPVITAISATRTSTGFTVLVTGYSSTRDVAAGAYQFAGNALANLLNNQVSTPVGTIFTGWYGSSASAPFGSQFTLTQPFTVTGDTATIRSVTVTLTNSVGSSGAVTANLQ